MRVYKKNGVWVGSHSTLQGLLLSLEQERLVYQRGQFEEFKGQLNLTLGETLFQDGKKHVGHSRNGLLEGPGFLADYRAKTNTYGTWVGGLLAGRGFKLEEEIWYQVEWQQGIEASRQPLDLTPDLRDY